MIDPTLGPVAAGTALLGAACGAVGGLAVVRRRSLQCDVAAHAALPGAAVGVLAGVTADGPLVLCGAAGGWAALTVVRHLGRVRRVGPDAALAVVLSVAFGLGLVLLKLAPGREKVLSTLLRGQDAAVIQTSDLLPLLAVVGVVAGTLAVLWKEFEWLAFDPDQAALAGRPVGVLDAIFTALLVLVVAAGVQVAGVVLVGALAVAPGVAARQWANRLVAVVLLAAGIGATAGLLGTFAAHALSGRGSGVPTGPVVVLLATAAAFASVFLKPCRGTVAA